MKIEIQIESDYFDLAAAVLQVAMNRLILNSPDENGVLYEFNCNPNGDRFFTKITLTQQECASLKKDQQDWIDGKLIEMPETLKIAANLEKNS